MKSVPVLALAAAFLGTVSFASAVLTSPDGRVAMDFSLRGGRPVYQVSRDGRVVLTDSKLGLVRGDADFTQGLTLAGTSVVESVVDEYEILTAKRRHISYRANRQVFNLTD